MIVDKELFFSLQKKILNIPFNQTREWLECGVLESICKIVYIVDNIENPHIACWGRETSKFYFGRKLMIDGLSYDISSIQHKDLTEFFNSLTKERYTTIEISDIEVYSPIFEIGIRRAGFVRPWGLSLCPMSILVDLQKDFQFHRNWRRNVKKSIDAGNKFIYVEKPTIYDAKKYVELFNSLKERKSIGYNLSVKEIYSLLQGEYDLFFIVDKNDRYLSGRIEYKCTDLVYDTYAATTFDGIKTGAAYHIQEFILDFYKKRGFRRFDYGRISPSQDKMDDIFLAKSYSGGAPVGYNGQWVYTTNKFKTFFKSIYFYLIKNDKCY